MNEREQKGVISICILAALADGTQSEAERTQIQKIGEGFQQNPMLVEAYQEVLGQKLTLADAVERLESHESKALAYEMAVCVCHADGIATEDERRFLENLRTALRLEFASSASIGTQVEELAQTPPVMAGSKVANAAEEQIDQTILNTAILTGALELLPESLATMAIIPLQMRMVYRIGQQHGFELGRGHIQDFLATVGVGLTSQVVEGFARKLVGNLTQIVGGRLLGGVAEMATGSAAAFGTTYALGQVAKRYYAAGRRLDAAQLREVFSSLLNEGSALQQKYTSQIVEKSRQIDVSQLLPLVRGS